ncbi:MAG: hypothetical protein EOO48_13350 [Flavobacterium sp.]|nr:MAG: hypothetical protein EOO48_13350 [Flavobacterium sp.]
MERPPTPWHKKKIYFLGVEMEFIYFTILFLVWNFLLCFVIPIFLGSYFFIFSFLCTITVVLIGVALKGITLLLVLLQFIYKKSIGVIYYLLLFVISFLVILVYGLATKTYGLMLFDCYMVNLFSAHLMNRFFIEANAFDN